MRLSRQFLEGEDLLVHVNVHMYTCTYHLHITCISHACHMHIHIYHIYIVNVHVTCVSHALPNRVAIHIYM